MDTKRKYIFTLFLVILIALLFFLYVYRSVFLRVLSPVVIGVVIAYFLDPIAKMLEKRGMKKRTSILFLYVIFLALSSMIIIFLIPEVTRNVESLVDAMPGISEAYNNKINFVFETIQKSKLPDSIKESIFNQGKEYVYMIQDFLMSTMKSIIGGIGQIITFLLNLTIGLFLAYYFMKDKEVFKRTFLNFIPSNWRRKAIQTGNDINLILHSFLNGQIVVAGIVGILETVGLFVIGIRYPLILGIVGGISNIIPYIGPIIGGVPAVALALIDSPAKAIITVLLYVVVQQIDSIIITPKIVEGRLGIHPVSSVIMVLIGGEFFGIIGMILAIPFFSILKAIFKRTVDEIV